MGLDSNGECEVASLKYHGLGAADTRSWLFILVVGRNIEYKAVIKSR